jgi:gluconokinase
MDQYVIGVDIGTGSAKAIAVTEAGTIISFSQHYYPTTGSVPGFAEQDPELIWQAFIACIREITLKIVQPPSVISLSSCMHSLLLLDSGNSALTPLITWADTRSEKIAARLRKSDTAVSFYEATGTPIHSMSPLSKILWFRENEPAIFAQASKFISIKEFIWHRLFNTFEIDYSIASATGIFDIRHRKWYEPALKLCNIDNSKLSLPVHTSFSRSNTYSQVASALQIPVNTVFCIGSSDGCLANLGSGAVKPGVAAVTIGTSGALRIASPVPIMHYESMLFNYMLDDKTFITGGPINNGGNVLKWVFRTILGNDTPSELDYVNFFNSVSEVRPGCQGLIFLPYLHGERAPVWDGAASGAFVGIRSWHNKNHFLRASLEGVCFALNQILEAIELASGPVDQIQASGGFVHSYTWMQILADISGKKLCMVENEDASAMGAALLGLKISGLTDEYNFSQKISENIIDPNLSNHTVYEHFFKIYKSLYLPLKDSMHRLNQIGTNEV